MVLTLRSKGFNSIRIWSCHDARPVGLASAQPTTPPGTPAMACHLYWEIKRSQSHFAVGFSSGFWVCFRFLYSFYHLAVPVQPDGCHRHSLVPDRNREPQKRLVPASAEDPARRF
jgi:hypothetical protein